MPSHETLERFIARVEENKHVEAIDEFYAEQATMQENQAAPRVGGKAAHRAREAKVMARAAAVRSRCVRPTFRDGDCAVLRWVFEFDWLDGTRTRIEEVAWQRWEGELIASEQFFYDPAQQVPKAPTS